MFGFGNKVKVTEPANVKKDFVKYCKKVLNQYK
jgi:predicted DNA-binding transcriptional regulator YafY